MRSTWLAGVVLVVGAFLAARADDKGEPDRTGTVTGLAQARSGNWIEVKADGEEKARKYYTGSDPAALKAVKETEPGSRVRLEWRFREVYRVVKIEVLKAPEKDRK